MAVVRQLLADGWTVLGIDLQPHPVDIAGRIETRKADLSRPGAPEEIDLTMDSGFPEAIVHCAGIMRDDRHPQIREDHGDALWRLHVTAAACLIGRMKRTMPDGRGRIVVMSSRAALGRAGRAHYAASKAAVTGLVRSFAAELAPRGITVNAVSPASTETPMLRDPERAGAPVLTLPIGRLISAEEVAALICFLIGPQAGAITGQTIQICGGASIAGLAPAGKA